LGFHFIGSLGGVVGEKSKQSRIGFVGFCDGFEVCEFIPQLVKRLAVAQCVEKGLQNLAIFWRKSRGELIGFFRKIAVCVVHSLGDSLDFRRWCLCWLSRLLVVFFVRDFAADFFVEVLHESPLNLRADAVDVVRDVAAAKLVLAKSGYEANCVAMSANVFEYIRRSTLLQNQFFGVISNTGARLLNEAEIAAALGVQTLAVGRAAYNTANKGKSYSGSFIVPDSKIIVGQIAGGEFTAGGIGRTLVWAADAAGFVSESYRDEARRSNVLRVRMNTDEVVIDSNAAVRITTNYSAS